MVNGWSATSVWAVIPHTESNSQVANKSIRRRFFMANSLIHNLGRLDGISFRTNCRPIGISLGAEFS
jgi:hypothetical protein